MCLATKFFPKRTTRHIDSLGWHRTIAVPVPVLPCNERTSDLDGCAVDTCDRIDLRTRSYAIGWPISCFFSCTSSSSNNDNVLASVCNGRDRYPRCYAVPRISSNIRANRTCRKCCAPAFVVFLADDLQTEKRVYSIGSTRRKRIHCWKGRKGTVLFSER